MAGSVTRKLGGWLDSNRTFHSNGSDTAEYLYGWYDRGTEWRARHNSRQEGLNTLMFGDDEGRQAWLLGYEDQKRLEYGG